MPFFSVVIPLYNKENYIQNTIESTLNQTFTDFEIIVVNDGSTDDSLNIVERFCQNANVHLFNRKNHGLSATRNFGIRKAKGQIIVLLDADDFWNPNYLSTLYELQKKFPTADLFGSDYIELYNEKNFLEPKKNISKELKNTSFLVDDFFEISLFQPIFCPSSFAFKKSVFDAVQFNEKTQYAEDIEFFIECNLNYKLAYSYRALVKTNFDIPYQMTRVGFKGKTIIDFNQFEKFSTKNISLKKYIDRYRYYFLIDCKINRDLVNLKKLKEYLILSNLTMTQRFLLKCPLVFINLLKKIKAYFLRKNIRLTSY